MKHCYRILTLAVILLISIHVAAPAAPVETKPRAEFRASNGIHRMAISPDGKYLALGIEDGSVRLLELPALRPATQFTKSPPARAESLVFTPDSTALAVAWFEGTYSIWQVPAGTLTRSVNGEGLGGAVAISPDGQSILTFPTSVGIGIWDTRTGVKRALRKLVGPGSDQGAGAAVFSRNAKRLATSGLIDSDNTVRVWDVGTGKLLRHLKPYRDPVNHLALTLDGSRLITGGNDGIVRVWDVPNGRSLRTWKLGGFIMSVAISADGKQVAASTDSQPPVQVWELASGRVIARLPGHPDGARDLQFSPGGKLFITAAFDVAKVWDLPRP